MKQIIFKLYFARNQSYNFDAMLNEYASVDRAACCDNFNTALKMNKVYTASFYLLDLHRV